ncbi:hypothetical protein SAMN05880501_103222 [Ureibacillus xyleni]|uniref:Uncharacterized protein n=1 Tax=Ureibacillus xyleni TaxID=614648 RepID=A0A285S775_9BACL|nr:hypothetical protein [Ureibacillus xyleni]SOC03315.1 hypothetical protein SAMN05880501_103222 [Ureibacillus xyleni]
MDLTIEQLIEKQTNNLTTQGELALNTFEAMHAISTSEARWRELKEQGKLKRVFRSLTGKNRKIEQAMTRDFITFQQCAQQSIENLAERQSLTIDLLLMIKHSQNLIQTENNRKFNEINKFLKAFLSDSQRKMNQLSERIDSLEVNVQMLTWKATLERMTFRNKSVFNLSKVEQGIYLSTSFYRISKGKWKNEDILLLEMIMDHLDVRGEVEFRGWVSSFLGEHSLIKHYLDFVPSYNVEGHPYIEGNLIFALVKYNQGLINKRQVLETVPRSKVEIRDIVFYLINGLAALETACKKEDIAQQIGYEMLLESVHPDERIYVHSVLRKYLKLSIEQCRELTKQVPISLGIFEDEQQLLQMKDELEKLDCVVVIN